MPTPLERLAISRQEQGEKSPHIDATRLDVGGTQVTSTAAELNKLDGVTATTAELNKVAGLLATTAELNRAADVSTRLVSAGATLTCTLLLHDGKTVTLDDLAGSEITLPAATGTGMRLRFCVSVTATSSAHKISCVGTDDMLGSLMSIDVDTSDATLAFAAEIGDTMDTITFNRTTTGLAALGDWVELEDVASGVWAVTGTYQANGTVTTPFTSAVS